MPRPTNLPGETRDTALGFWSLDRLAPRRGRLRRRALGVQGRRRGSGSFAGHHGAGCLGPAGVLR
jgi:hypothetical protein